MLPLRIGVDIDGVLADFTRPYLGKLIAHTGVQQPNWNPNRDPDCWDWYEKYGYSKEQAGQVWKSLSESDSGSFDFWANLPILASCYDVEFLRDAHERHDFYFITSRPKTAKQATEVWLSQEIKLIMPTVLLSDSKGHIARGLDLHMMFDDMPQNLLSVLSHCGTDCTNYLIDRPWNQEFNHPYVHRVGSITEGYDKWQKANNANLPDLDTSPAGR